MVEGRGRHCESSENTNEYSTDGQRSRLGRIFGGLPWDVCHDLSLNNIESLFVSVAVMPRKLLTTQLGPLDEFVELTAIVQIDIKGLRIADVHVVLRRG